MTGGQSFSFLTSQRIGKLPNLLARQLRAWSWNQQICLIFCIWQTQKFSATAAYIDNKRSSVFDTRCRPSPNVDTVEQVSIAESRSRALCWRGVRRATPPPWSWQPYSHGSGKFFVAWVRGGVKFHPPPEHATAQRRHQSRTFIVYLLHRNQKAHRTPLQK